MRFYMYRTILNADDFKWTSALFCKGSVGDLYISSSSFHVRSRQIQKDIRTLLLTLAAVPTNVVVDHLIRDLVSGSFNRVECIDALREKAKAFFDIFGSIRDYAASTAVVDLKCHTATAPCTHFGFTSWKTWSHPIFAHATSVHSCTTLHRRSHDRAMSLL